VSMPAPRRPMQEERRRVRTHVRMGVVLTLPGLLAGLVVARSYSLQVLQHEELAREAHRQQAGVTRSKGRRGSIYDRDGVVLSSSAPVMSAWANPKEVTDPRGTTQALAAALDLPGKRRRSLRRRLGDARLRFTWIKRHLTPDETAAVKALRLDGVDFREESRRYWPLKETASQVLGIANIDGLGLTGLEQTWEDELSGDVEVLRGLRDAQRRLILPPGSGRRVTEGNSLKLTLHVPVQQETEAALADAVSEANATSGVAIAMLPRTGDLVAIAHYPRFNPNSKERDPERYQNRAVSESFEPGSVMKPVTLTAALAHKVVRTTTPFSWKGRSYRIGGRRISDIKAHVRLTAAACLEVSSNICFAMIAEKLGKERLWQNLKDFGFGDVTGSGMHRESSGIVHPTSRWWESTLATVSYGYGLQVTHLQLITAYAAIANGGLLPRPRLVSHVLDPSGRTLSHRPPETQRRIMSEGIARKVRTAMTRVIHGEGGTAKRARLDGYRVAGKTGTARKWDPVVGRYVERYVSTFIGMAPAAAPEIVVLVSINEPGPKIYAGDVAAPAFVRIATEALTVLEVPADPGLLAEARAREEKARSRRRRRGLEPPPNLAKAQIAPPAPPPAAKPEPDARVPDFAGMSLRRVLVAAAHRNLLVETVGGGRAAAQSLPPGSPVVAGKICRVEMHPVL
jgi:cell division protein FtsI (penicillin-binding protein 3)